MNEVDIAFLAKDPHEELFSPKCIDRCRVSRTTSHITCISLGSLGTGRCRGVAKGEGGVSICSLPGELAEAIAETHPDVPGSAIMGAAHAIVRGELAYCDLPLPTADPAQAVREWEAALRTLEPGATQPLLAAPPQS